MTADIPMPYMKSTPKSSVKLKKFRRDDMSIGHIKVFSTELFNKYDVTARDKLKSVLGDYLKDNPNKYQQDFIINSKVCRYKYLEVQVCASWNGIAYPNEKLHIYERKKHYINDTLFITLSNDLSRAYLFDLSKVNLNKPSRLKKYSREFVYYIPLTDALLVSVDNLDHLTFDWL